MSDRGRIALGAMTACLLAIAAPGSAHAQLSAEGTHGGAAAYGVVDVADVSTTPLPDGLQVSMGAAADNVYGLSTALWLEDFRFDASMLGTGEVTWGAATAALTLSATAKPQLTYATPQNAGNGPLANAGSSGADGLLALQFTDTATVTSPTLPAGTPVTLEFHFLIASTSLEVGLGPDSHVGSTFTGTVTSLTAPATSLMRLLLGSQTTSATFDTAVGHVVRLQGELRASGEIHAGYRPGCCAFETDVEAGTEVSAAGLWVVTPGDVDLVTSSGADYTQLVPEAGSTAAGATSLLALAAMRVAARRRLRLAIRSPLAMRARENRS